MFEKDLTYLQMLINGKMYTFKGKNEVCGPHFDTRDI